MATLSWVLRIPLLAAAFLMTCAQSYAQTTLLNTVNTLAAPTQGVPIQETFQITTAGTYTVTLVDFGAQQTPAAPLASVGLAVTNGSAIVGTPLTAAGSAQFTAAASGTYTVQVVGAPGTGAGSGPIGIQITSSTGTQIASFSPSLALPSGPANDTAPMSGSFTVSTSGNYQVTLSDLQLPQALSSLTMAITTYGPSGDMFQFVPNSTLATSTGTPIVSATVALQSGVTYNIFAGGAASTSVNAGLFGVNVTPSGGGAPVYSNSVPVGAVTSVSTPTLTAANYTITLADLSYPAALSSLGAVVVLNGQSAATLIGSGPAAFNATANPYQVYAVGVPASSGLGSYALNLQPTGGTSILNIARAVAAPGGTSYAYAYDTTTVAETYALSLGDFGFPAQFTSLSAVVVQNGALVGSPVTASNSPGAMTTAAGPLSVLVFSQPATSATVTAGLFGLDLTANGAATPTYQTTQGVGELFAANTINVTTGGQYQVSINDLGFPSAFGSLAVLVTQGTTVIGHIYNAGSFNFAATAGDYFVNVLAQPQGAYEAGTYVLTVGPVPPAATLTLQSSATSVTSGGTVTLSWSAQNATSCTASGGWSGNQPVSGQATSPTITADTTFTLTCTGNGGSVTQSVTVNLAAAASKGGGGGGAIRLDVLAVLFMLALLRVGSGLPSTVWRTRSRG